MIEKPDWMLGDGISKPMRKIFEQFFDQSNAHEKAIADAVQEYRGSFAVAAGERGKLRREISALESRVKALEDKSKYHRHCKSSDHDDFTTQPRYFYQELENGETDAIKTAELSTSAAKTDNMSAQNVDKLDHGRWICNNCGKDWGDGFAGIRRDGTYLCPKYEGGCDQESVTWHTTLSQSEELKPCPFCGGGQAVTSMLIGGKVDIVCISCGHLSVGFDDEISAIAAWNRRPEEDRLRAENERLKPLAANGIDLANDLAAARERIKNQEDIIEAVLTKEKRTFDDLAAANEKIRQYKIDLDQRDNTIRELRHENTDYSTVDNGLRNTIAAANKRIEKALTLLRANLTYYEDDPYAVIIRDTCAPRDVRQVIAALTEESV
jgi:rubrerythrin